MAGAGSVPTATYAIMSMNNDRSAGLMDRVDLRRLLGTRAGDEPALSLPQDSADGKKNTVTERHGRKTEYIHFGAVEACGIL
jgi:hypothetical protein